MRKIMFSILVAGAALVLYACSPQEQQKAEQKKASEQKNEAKNDAKIEVAANTQKQQPAAEAEDPSEVVAPDNVSVEEKWAFLPAVVAKIGNKDITKEQFIQLVSQRYPNVPISSPQVTKEILQDAAFGIAQDIVDGMVLLQLAEKAGFKPSEELVAAEFDKMFKKLPPEALEPFKKNLEASGMTVESYKEKMKKDKMAQEGIAIDSWIKETVLAKINVTPEEIKDFYGKNKDSFKENEKAKVSHILIRPEQNTDEAKAAAKKKTEEILKKITSGSLTFEKAAEQESQCPLSKTKKGELPDIEKGSMVEKIMGPEFVAAAFALAPGKMSGVVETQNGFHIIKMQSKSPAKEKTLDEVSEKIAGFLKNQKTELELKKIIDSEKEKQAVKIFLEAPKKPEAPQPAAGAPVAPPTQNTKDAAPTKQAPAPAKNAPAKK